jgi:peptidoglycan/LPS O-acetylase OafA/YrhL
MPPLVPPSTTPRVAGIDLLRGLCILSVILLHQDIRVPFKLSALGAHLSQPVLNTVFRNGYYGVIIFFVISGFLISGISIKRWGSLENINAREFYRMRFARIAPSLLLVLAISSTLHLAGIRGFVIHPQQTTLARALFSALTFHLNWLEAKVGYLPGAWDVLWSLCVEEAFYFGFPLACKWLKSLTLLSLFMMFFVVIGPFARTVFTQNEIWQDHSYLSCMDAIAFGCLAAILASRFQKKYASPPESESRAAGPLRLLGIGALLFFFFLRHYVFTRAMYRTGLDVTFLEISTAVLLMGFAERKAPRRNPLFATLLAPLCPLEWLGRYSYETYLTHSFVVILLTQVFDAGRFPFHSVLGWYVVVMGLSAAVGFLLARYYSEPLNRKIRRQSVPRELPTHRVPDLP